jgi:hypothetical protein
VPIDVDKDMDFDPEERIGAGVYARVDTTVTCVLTRFQLRSVWWLVPFYLAYRRTRQETHGLKGLLKTAFLIEGPRTCYTLSIWAEDSAIIAFGTRARSHIDAANASFAGTADRETGRPGIWSAQFKLWSISCTNLNWAGLDLEPVLGDQMKRRDEVSTWLAGGRSGRP